MPEQATVTKDRAARAVRRTPGADEKDHPIHALSRLSLRAFFWLLIIGALALAEILTLAASLLVFHTARPELLLTALPVGAVTAGILSFTVMRVIGHLRMQQVSLER